LPPSKKGGEKTSDAAGGADAGARRAAREGDASAKKTASRKHGGDGKESKEGKERGAETARWQEASEEYAHFYGSTSCDRAGVGGIRGREIVRVSACDLQEVTDALQRGEPFISTGVRIYCVLALGCSALLRVCMVCVSMEC